MSALCDGTELSDPERHGFLRDEYLLLQNQYEDFDRRSLTIKGWAVAGAVAGLALTFKSDGPGRLVPLLVAVVAIMVWALEAAWKLFQYALADRIRVIEAYFRGDREVLVDDFAPFQSYHWWFRTFVRDEPIFSYETSGPNARPRSIAVRFWAAAWQPFVFAPYVVILALSALVWRLGGPV